VPIWALIGMKTRWKIPDSRKLIYGAPVQEKEEMICCKIGQDKTEKGNLLQRKIHCGKYTKRKEIRRRPFDCTLFQILLCKEGYGI